MEWVQFILLFYKEQRFIFGICPCCRRIFQLTDCAIYFGGKRMRINELDEMIEHGQALQEKEEKLESFEGDLYGLQENIATLESEYEEQVQPIIEKKYKMEGRRQALARIQKIDKVFTRKKIDPRDIRLIFDPVEFVAFKGVTDGEEVSSIAFVTKMPETKSQEEVTSSIAKTIKNGNYEFTLIRIKENGTVDYLTGK
jgi:predicted Holliday junction resolvase-like endonuclease